jgi:hypothetical protein
VSRRANEMPPPFVRQMLERGAAVIISVTSSVCFKMNWVHSSRLCACAQRSFSSTTSISKSTVHELEQVEQEQRHVAVRDRADVRDRGRAGDARLELTEPQRSRVGVEQEVQLELAAVPLLPQAFTHGDRAFARDAALRLGQEFRGDIVPHQPPSYGVSSGNPVSSAIRGPTKVPWRVITPSMASSRGSIPS